MQLSPRPLPIALVLGLCLAGVSPAGADERALDAIAETTRRLMAAAVTAESPALAGETPPEER